VGEYRYDIRNRPEDRGLETAILGADDKSIVELNPYGTTGSDEDLKLLAAAPEMYQTLRKICSEDSATRAEAFLAAKSIVARLEGQQ
jgi:hypothetical protein